MNDTLEKTSSSSSALVEKKSQKTGGCVGIFFQLFDWNRRFAKKKLFSKKLLPPVWLKQSSKKFGRDEKQAKLRLIADENSGGFPTTKKNNVDMGQHQEMRVPGLVARLMGLESIPRDKSKELPPPSSNYALGKVGKSVDNVNGHSKDGPDIEKGGIKHELRPLKLQKTSLFSERQPLTRFGTEKLPFKNVLTKSRKHSHHHPKLPSPVKSPRNVSRKNTSKLLGAATRILEPSSKSKCALTYTNTLHCHQSQNTVVEDSSCTHCGHQLVNFDATPAISEKQLVSASPSDICVGPSRRVSERSKLGNSLFYQQELRRDYDGDLQSCVQYTSCNKSPFSGQIQRNSSSHPNAPPLSLSPNHNTRARIQMFPPRPKSNNANGTKSFFSVNQSLSSGIRPRLPSRAEIGKLEADKRILNSPNDSVPTGRKRRGNVSRQDESGGFISSVADSRNFGSEKHLGCNAHCSNSRNGLLDLQERTVGVANSVVSFTFNSHVNHKSGIQEVGERRNQNDFHCDDRSSKSVLGESGGRAKLEKPFPLSGDALGALLQQKLKELNNEGDDIESNGVRKTTSMILQELICALTSEKPFQQANAVAAKLSVDEHSLDSERPSPGSVLEAYFSTESCRSSSVDESLGCKMLDESIECSNSRPRSPTTNLGLLDYAASITNKHKSSDGLVINILSHVSEILSCNIFTNYGSKVNKLDEAKESLLNAELILHSAALSGTVVGKGCPIKHLLLHELETLASVLWMNFGNSLGIENDKESNQLKLFVVDSIIEYLDGRFGKYLESGPNVSGKLPHRMNSNILIFEIVEVVGRWYGLSRYDNLDELIEREMSAQLGDWTECESEGFETGMGISGEVLQNLMDEIVIDLLEIC
ncbi:hypothetical protein OROGR_018100 [Orobanche gracilis]